MQTTTSELQRTHGRSLHYYDCNITEIGNIKQMYYQIQIEVEEIDLLVNNAGIFNCKFLQNLSDEDIQMSINLNRLSYIWVGTATVKQHKIREYQIAWLLYFRTFVRNWILRVS